MLMNIPRELRERNQWCCSDYKKERRWPLTPTTLKMANPTDPSTWGTFSAAVASQQPCVGYVLHKDDPYTIIDLDQPINDKERERHSKIIKATKGYMEVSTSGTGVHIITRGHIPNGVKRNHVEVYSDARYMICTGKVLRNAPIVDEQEVLDILYKEMHSATQKDLVDGISHMTDEELVDMATAATNGHKFVSLCNGDMTGYPSQSEADFALLSILAFYSRDNEQVRRIFRMSVLGQRVKANKNNYYLDQSLSRIRAKQAPLVDIQLVPPAPINGDAECPLPPESKVPAITYPNGLIGEIAAYFYHSAIRPVHEVAITGAIGLMAGITGRAFNISGTGLNQYLIVLAKTGSGKEGIATGVDMLLSRVADSIPMIDSFLGPGVFASGQALLKVLDEKPCFISILGEIGLTLQQLCDPRAPTSLVMLRRVLLDLYGKSGWTKVLRPMAYSDKEKNTKTIHAPAVTLIGESTPETFFDCIGESHIAEGLIPRFSIIQYKGKRPPRNHQAFHLPSPSLVDKVGNIVMTALSAQQGEGCIQIGMDQPALEVLDAFDAEADNFINDTQQDVVMQLWNRAHLKALKLAGLLAATNSPYKPIVNREEAEYAVSFVRNDIGVMLEQFDRLTIGYGDARLDGEIRKAIEEYCSMSQTKRESYGAPKSVSKKNIIPYAFLRRKLRPLSVFKDDKRGATTALQSALSDMVLAEVLDRMPDLQAKEIFNVRSPLYVKGSGW